MRLVLALLASASLGACAAAPPSAAPAPAPAAPEPVYPLDQTTRRELPPTVRTVQQAAAYLLEPTGYHLVTVCGNCPPESAEIAAKPISPLAFAGHPFLTSITRALILVGGSRTRLVVDDQTHLVRYSYLPAPQEAAR